MMTNEKYRGTFGWKKSLRYTCQSKVSKVGDLSQGWPKAPFLIDTTPRCWGGHYTFPWIAPLYPWSLPYIAEC